jgi:ribosomal protein S18 acetylase RimI-like enzyme
MFTIRHAELPEILAAHALIPEFTLGGEAYFRERLEGKTALSLIAWDGNKIAGYSVSYLQGDAAYIWLVGTSPEYRGQGVYRQIFEDIQQWAKAQGARKLQLKTRNSYRTMLAWLVRNDFLFVKIDTQDNIMENRILAEKVLV